MFQNERETYRNDENVSRTALEVIKEWKKQSSEVGESETMSENRGLEVVERSVMRESVIKLCSNRKVGENSERGSADESENMSQSNIVEVSELKDAESSLEIESEDDPHNPAEPTSQNKSDMTETTDKSADTDMQSSEVNGSDAIDEEKN